MSQKVYPIFNRIKSTKKSNQKQDDSIVYLGEHVSKSKNPTNSDSDSGLAKNILKPKIEPTLEPKTDHPQTLPNIKTEKIECESEDVSVLQYYSQEQDTSAQDPSDDDETFHSSFVQIDKNVSVRQENNDDTDVNSFSLENDDDDDEDIKLIFDSRDLIEEIFKKYDNIGIKSEPITKIVNDSPILVKEKEKENNNDLLKEKEKENEKEKEKTPISSEILTEKEKATKEVASPEIVDQKPMKANQTIWLNDDSNDSDTDILLCNAVDQFEKTKTPEVDKKKETPTPKSDSSKKSIEIKNNFNLTPNSSRSKQASKIKNFTFDSLFESSSDEESKQPKKSKIENPAEPVQFLSKFSSKTPSKPPPFGAQTAKLHTEIIQNLPVKRTILVDSSPDSSPESRNKKQKISPNITGSSSNLNNQNSKPIPKEVVMEVDDNSYHEIEGLSYLDAQKKLHLKNLKPTRLYTVINKKLPFNQPKHVGITNKKHVELLLNNKLSKPTSFQSDQNDSFSLTQTMNLAKREKMARNMIEAAKTREKIATEANKALSSNQSNSEPSNTSSNSYNNNKSHPVKPVDKPKDYCNSNQKEKENECKHLNKPASSVNKPATVAKTYDIVGNILNEMNNQKGANPSNQNQVSNKNEFIFENFIFRLLKCSFYWLIEQDKFSNELRNLRPPPVVRDEELGVLIDNYVSYEDYYKTMFPLLLSETWEDVFRSWREGKNEKRTYQDSPIWLKAVDKTSQHQEIIVLTCQIIIDQNSRSSPSEDDLLKLTLNHKVIGKENLNQENLELFGIVRNTLKLKKDDPAVMKCVRESIKSEEDKKQKEEKQAVYSASSPCKSTETNSNTYKNNANASNHIVYEFYVFVRYRKYITSPGMKIDYQLIAALSSSFRRAKALISFQKSPLLKTILNGTALDPSFWFNKDTQDKFGDKQFKLNQINDYNESQRAVIMECSSMINYNEPKLYFIQGPPGTGKSHTIVGIINAFYGRLKYYRNNLQTSGTGKETVNKKLSNFKILICSPSNGGCDELTRRIKSLITKKNSNLSTFEMKRDFNLVRIGRSDNIHRDCEDVTLDILSRKKLDELVCNKQMEKSNSLQEHYKHLKNTEQILSKKIKALKTGNSNEKIIKEMETQFGELLKKKKKFEDQLAKNSQANNISQADRKKFEQQAKEMVLKEADIVVCTLNFSGNSVLDCLTMEKNNGQSLINTIIIDEAAQCLEVESLIPLRFGCDKIIQVGDPQQLPATVLSKLAQDKGFGMSLFERIHQRFRFIDQTKNPIRMLYVQYRMHPDICSFPSKNFYYGKLITHPDAVQKRSHLDLRPYLVFNVRDSQEIGDEVTGSVFNPNEAEKVLDHCKWITQKYSNYSLGIITPYQRQSHYLRDLLNKNNLQKVEVGTVDGYQGREKDIIIFSSVRANNPNRTIGFLAHRQRLNVALTRAKYALYIFCHVKSLRVNEDWKNCMDDAQERELIVTLD